MPIRTEQIVEERVHAWLEAENASFLDSQRSSSGFRANVDFLVIRPFAFAIEVFGSLSPASLNKRRKRLLATRIEIALAFSRDLPLIGVVPDDAVATEIPFVDRVFRVSELPSIDELQGMKPSEIVSRILNFGGKTDFPLSSAEQLEDKFRDALSLDEVLADRSWAEGTLANKLKSTLSRIEVKSVDNQGVDARLKVRQVREIDTVFTSFLESAVPCTRALLKARIDAKSLIQFDTFESSVGKKFIVRRFSGDGAWVMQKSRELLADAWILRSLFGIKNDDLILVVFPVSSWFRETISGRRIDLSQLAHVNALESAGWNVFPSDFGSKTPTFVEHMRRGEASD